jgi:GT2 family glycosyltransferase
MSSIFPLYAVIPNWNLAADTISCVESLFAAAEGLDVAVIVVDNASTDGSQEALAASFGRRVIQLQMPRNMGFTGAVNAGMRYSMEHGAAAALILNNDTVVDRKMLVTLGQAARAHPEAGILGPAIYYMHPPDRVWRLGDRDYRWLPIPLRIPDREAADELVYATYGTGCGMLVRREVIEGIGYLDDQFFMYYEDADYCRRATQKGFRVLCVPAARMWHKGSASAGQDGPNQVFWRARGQAIFYRKHARRGYHALAHGFVVAKTAVMWLRFSARGQQAQARSLVRGAWAGYRTRLTPEAHDG